MAELREEYLARVPPPPLKFDFNGAKLNAQQKRGAVPGPSRPSAVATSSGSGSPSGKMVLAKKINPSSHPHRLPSMTRRSYQ